MNIFIVTNMSTGEEFRSTILAEAFEAANWDRLDSDRLSVKSIASIYNLVDVNHILERMMMDDPNGSWNYIDLTNTGEIYTTLVCAINTLNRWSTEATNQLDKYEYYRRVLEIEEVLSK